MFEGENHHLGPQELTQLLWLAARYPRAGRAVIHLIAACDGCWRPVDFDDEERGDLADAHFDDGSLGALAWKLLSCYELGLAPKLGHLLKACPTCWALAEPLFDRHGPAASPEDYPELANRYEDLCIHQSWETLLERQQTPELLRRLLAKPAPHRALLLRNIPSFHSAPLVDALTEESRRAAPRDPEEARELAELALSAAAHLEVERYGPRIVEDLKALTHAFRANALRVAQRLDEAEAAFRLARRHQAKGSGLAPVGAEIDSLEASLYALRRNFRAARRLLEGARAVYQDLGEEAKIARLLVLQAKVCREAGEAEEACCLVTEALPKIDAQAEPRLFLCAVHNRLVSLIDLGRFDEAEVTLPKVRALAESLENQADLFHTRWAEAEIAAGRGRHTRAEVLYGEVRDELRVRRRFVDLGLASLQLGRVHVDDGRLDLARPILEEAYALLSSQGIERDAETASLLLARCAS